MPVESAVPVGGTGGDGPGSSSSPASAVVPLSERPLAKVIVHPLVLLSVVDHFNRMRKVGHARRVVGVLLGSVTSGEGGQGRVLDISNSFAVPFDEDDKDGDVWFLDHEYLENMYNMFKKVNAKERIVGWYHTGPKLHPNDIKINDLLRSYCEKSILVIVNAKPKNIGLPTEAYIAVEEIHDDGTPTSKTFEHVPSEIGAEEAEEVGVEHLLRDIKDTTLGTLSQRITNQLMGWKGLNMKLHEMKQYLQQVIDGKLPMNHQITYHLQDIFNLLPDLADPDFVKSTNVNTNDQMLVVYTASLIRSIIALHNLINNKLSNKEAEKKETTTTTSSAAGKKEDSKEKTSKDEAKDKAKEEKK
ncbi:26S proteasome non-ATPase regulatory subunit 7-like [Tigriopus californicus]|nr:26S proteasome non-ATPase regulatory subunit 7-like [Tigriopus californicus]